MKKNIIIAAIAAASALLLSVSCQKENQPESQDGINGGANIFTATIEQSITKTTITADYKVNWTATDKININGKSYTAIPRTDATKSDFTADDGEATPDDNNKYKAIYPSTLYATDHFALPATQTYSAGAFNAPMYAESETQSLTFKNICAVLAIKVTIEDIATLKSIKVKADKKLHGTFTVASTTDGYKATIGTDGTEEVVLSSSNAITLTSEGTTFYIAIPEQEYSYLKIYLSEDGTLYKRAMITKKAVGTVSCNKIYNIDYQTNAVQLYANGPYWSTMNLGATSPQGYGNLYSWGNPTGQSGDDNYDPSFTDANYKNTEGYNINNTDHPWTKTTHDAAYNAWGGAWRMPTGRSTGEFQKLYDACRKGSYDKTTNPSGASASVGKGVYWCTNYDGVAGCLFCDGTNRLFFPAAGNSSSGSRSPGGSGGSYWSSTWGSSDFAYSLGFDGGSVGQGFSYRYFGFSVRPVSD